MHRGRREEGRDREPAAEHRDGREHYGFGGVANRKSCESDQVKSTVPAYMWDCTMIDIVVRKLYDAGGAEPGDLMLSPQSRVADRANHTIRSKQRQHSLI